MKGIVDAQGSFFLGAAPEKVNIGGEEHIYANVVVALGNGHDYVNPDLYPPAPELPKKRASVTGKCAFCHVLFEGLSHINTLCSPYRD
jgi:hypothetical protein